MVYLSRELALKLLVDRLDSRLGHDGKGPRKGQDLHGDLLLGDIVGDLRDVINNELTEKALDLGNKLLVHILRSLRELGASGQDVLGKELVELLLFNLLPLLLGETLKHAIAVLLLLGDNRSRRRMSQVLSERVLVHQRGHGDGVGGSVEALRDRVPGHKLKDLAGASKEPLSVEAKKILLELTIVDDGHDLKVRLGRSAGNVPVDESGNGSCFLLKMRTSIKKLT